MTDAADIAGIMTNGPLDDGTRELVALFAAVVAGPASGDAAMHEARRRGLPRDEVLEVVLQSYLFAGFPRCINALASFRSVFGGDPGEGASSAGATAADLETWRARGEALFRRIYATNADRVLEDLAAYHEDLRDWILVEAYGKVLARPSLDPRVRELAAVAALMVSGDTPQLSSHMRGAVHCGATAEEVRGAVELARPFCAGDVPRLAGELLEKLFP